MPRLQLVAASLLAWIAVGEARSETVPTAAPAAIREIHVRVLGLNGKPAFQRRIQVWGVSRRSLRDDEEKVEANWDFVTDRAGRCVVKLRDETGAMAGSIPGWGTYALRVVPGPRDAGAFSPFLIHEDDEWSRKNQAANRGHLEWGRPRVVAQRRMDLTLQIEPGFTIRGRVFRHPNHAPWPEVAVHGHYNLYAESHTGFGAMIGGPSAVTDGAGRYTLRHVYPSKLFLGTSQTWVQTKRDQRPWVTDRLDQIEPAHGQRTVSLDIVAATGKPFRVFGHVQDARGQPLENAQVSVGWASHRVPYWWHEEKAEQVSTDSLGNYEVWLTTPWITGITVNAGQHPETDFPGSEEGRARFRPGRFDFVLK